LKVQGFKDCLTDANTGKTSDPLSLGKPHQQYCLPKTKPNSCNQSSWDQLQDVQECPIQCHVLANETFSMEDLEGFDVKKINGKYCVEDVTQCKRIVGADKANETTEGQDEATDGQNKTIKCYVSKKLIPKKNLTDFFAVPENKNDCAKGVTQCQYTISIGNQGLKGYLFQCGPKNTKGNNQTTDEDPETHHCCGKDLCNECSNEEPKVYGNSGLSMKITHQFGFLCLSMILITWID